MGFVHHDDDFLLKGLSDVFCLAAKALYRSHHQIVFLGKSMGGCVLARNTCHGKCIQSIVRAFFDKGRQAVEYSSCLFYQHKTMGKPDNFIAT